LCHNRLLPPSKLLNRNKNLIGRKEYLDQIDKAFTIENKQIIILSSFQGTGKSSIANEIGHRFNDRSLNQFVYWMRSDENYLDEEFRQFAFDLKLINQDEKLKKPTEYIMKKIELKLKSNHLSEQFLFILDNCDSIEKTKEYFDFIIQDSALKNVKFLITTTIGSPFKELESIMVYIRNFSQNIIIQPFDKEESVNFFKSSLKEEIKNEEELDELIASLDIQSERPVTLNKLVALVKLKLSTINDYRSLIEEFKLKKRKLDSLDNELFENLIMKEEKAWNVLKQSSFLDPDFSPISIYIDLFKIDEEEFFNAKEVLTKLSLVTTEEDDEGMEYGLRIHRSLQKEAKIYFEINYEDEYQTITQVHYEKIKFIFENKPETNKWNKKNYYKNFIKVIWQNLLLENLNNEYKAKLSSSFARYSKETNLGLKDSLVFYEKLIEIYQKIHNTNEHSAIANIFNEIAPVYSDLGMYDQALENYSKSLKIYQKLFGSDMHSFIANVLNNIALVYEKLGRYEEALENYKKSLEINRSLFGTDEHLSIAHNLNNIAIIYKDLGRYQDALENYTKSMEIKQKIFGTDEKMSIAYTLNNIALVYNKQGRHGESLKNYQKSIDILRKIFENDDHISIAETLNNIANVYRDMGSDEPALENYKKSLEIKRKIFGNDEHPSIAGTLNNISIVFRKLKMLDESLENYEKSLEINRKIFGTDKHLSIANTLNNIANVHKDLGRLEDALENYSKSLEIDRKIFGTDEHPSIANTLNNIGSVYKELGRYEDALDNYSKSLEIKRKLFESDEHPSIIETLSNISLVSYLSELK